MERPVAVRGVDYQDVGGGTCHGLRKKGAAEGLAENSIDTLFFAMVNTVIVI